MTLSVTLYQSSNRPHTNLVLTGFLMLQEQGKIHLDIRDCRGLEGHPETTFFLLRADVDGLTLWFDTADGYSYTPERMEKANVFYSQGDFCFRRSYSLEENQRCFPELIGRIYPFGMNYDVTHPGNPIRFPSDKAKWKQVLRRFAGFKPDAYFTHDVFEAPANRCEGEPVILFYARLWQPSPVSHIWDDQNEEISRDRIAIVRLLKKEFPKTFIGGIYDDAYARKVCRDLIVSKYHTRRENFLRLVKRADICIASRGISKSTGWKTAEYVAASRAIVSERLRYETIGNFSDGIHYLSFETPEECLAQVVRLQQDKDRIYKMKQANETYYREYMRPDRQVWHALQFALEHRTSN